MRKFFSCFLVTVCFWLLAFFGPMLVMLWNNVGYAVTGGGYGKGSFLYSVLQFLSQPIAFAIAGSLAGSMFHGEHKLCAFVNCIVGACWCVFLALMQLAFQGVTALMFALLLSAIVSAYIAICLREQMPKKTADPQK